MPTQVSSRPLGGVRMQMELSRQLFGGRGTAIQALEEAELEGREHRFRAAETVEAVQDRIGIDWIRHHSLLARAW
jgi:hypothetical protein